MRRTVLWMVGILIGALFSGTVWADPSAREIIAQARKATRSKSSLNKIEMTMENKRGETLVQRMVTRAVTKNDLSRTVTTFLYPEETKGTKFLMIENPDREDDMKIFIPSLGRIRTISAAQRNQSYMGSDFAYGDLETLDPNTGEHALTGSEDVEGKDCYVISTGLDPKKGAGYSKMINWIQKENFVPVKVEYYDKDGQLKKVKTVHDLYRQDDVWILKRMVMRDVQRRHQTTIVVVESQQKKIDDSYFTDQFLRQTDKY